MNIEDIELSREQVTALVAAIWRESDLVGVTRDTSTFANEDARKLFFGDVLGALNCYWLGWTSQHVADSIVAGKRLRIDGISHDEKRNFDLYFTWQSNRPQRGQFQRFLNRTLLVDTWFAFEQYLICLLKVAAEPNSGVVWPDEKARKRFQIGRHIRISDATRAIMPVLRPSYSRTASDDTAFLKFFGDMRNSLHMYATYSGDDYDMTFRGIRFIFRKGKTIGFFASMSSLPVIILEMIKELCAIAVEINNNFQYNGVIVHPAHDASLNVTKW
ncbi:MAG: hypothetical protein HY423_09675 [Candidatus Lambdaproteobacteria bacterium]|nr:hypothetical protein [Candidatus Lambdaproteobacteria bacterium]